jgi:hypothetical protein
MTAEAFKVVEVGLSCPGLALVGTLRVTLEFSGGGALCRFSRSSPAPHHLPGHLIKVEWEALELALLQQAAQPVDHFAGGMWSGARCTTLMPSPTDTPASGHAYHHPGTCIGPLPVFDSRWTPKTHETPYRTCPPRLSTESRPQRLASVPLELVAQPIAPPHMKAWLG